MLEVVVAVFGSSRAAVAAIDDLEVARIPSVTVRQFSARADLEDGIMELRHPSLTPGERIVAVTVEDRHAQSVIEILDMQTPSRLTEAPLRVS
jgi:hypothetical protein